MTETREIHELSGGTLEMVSEMEVIGQTDQGWTKKRLTGKHTWMFHLCCDNPGYEVLTEELVGVFRKYLIPKERPVVDTKEQKIISEKALDQLRRFREQEVLRRANKTA